jgi:hypothetical protein
MAYETMVDHGDASRGEWIEDREKAFHLRRRLTADEESRVGPAVDCRETDEGVQRFQQMKAVLPHAIYPLVAEELGSRWVEA